MGLHSLAVAEGVSWLSHICHMPQCWGESLTTQYCEHEFLPTVTTLRWGLWPSVFAGSHPGFAVCEPFRKQNCCQMGYPGTSLLAAQSFVPLPTSVALLIMAEYLLPSVPSCARHIPIALLPPTMESFTGCFPWPEALAEWSYQASSMLISDLP